MTPPEPPPRPGPEPRRVLRGCSSRDEARPAIEVLSDVPWDGRPKRETLPAEAFLAALWD
ncbi:MAG: hypothetical protein AB1Z98_15605 [Nannocystaceae bacterium]